VFEDVTPISLQLIGGERSPAWFDMDNDGDLDLVISTMWNETPNIAMFENTGSAFIWVDDIDFDHEDQIGNSGMGLAIADINNDGDLDIATTWKFGKNLLLQNDLDNDNHWIKIKLEGSWYPNNRNAVGVRVEVTSGSVTQMKEVATGTGYWSQHSMVQHFGLGSQTVVDEIVVRWPSGDTQYVYPCSVDETICIVENQTQSNDCDEDVNRDCSVDVQDVLLLIGSWGICDNCSADVNGDSMVGVEDLLMVIGAWGDCL
jgi:hypothetical protein